MTQVVLAGRRAVITGGSQGLGREIARACLVAGADVLICARTPADIEAAATALRGEFAARRILSFVCDIGRTDDIDCLFDHAIAELGGFDILVNNAGIHGAILPLDEADWDLWCATIAVNLVGAVYCCRRAVRHFKSRPADGRHAKIINISGGGATSPQPGLSAYGASKAGLVRFTETLAMEVKPFGIDVNAVAPGALLTRLLEELRSVGPERIGAAQHAKVEEIYGKGGMSLARAAQLCVYLASSDSDGISGRLISAPWDPWPFSAEIAGELAASDIYTLRRIVPEDRGHSWPESS